MKEVLLYGMGASAEYIADNHDHDNVIIVGVVLTEKKTEKWKGINVYSINEISKLKYDELWLSNSHIETLDNCLINNVPKEKIVICNEILYLEYCNRNELIDIKYRRKEALEFECYSRGRSARLFTVTMDRYKVTPGIQINKEGFFYHPDYFRYQMLMLLIEEVKEKSLEGELAELGVYRGEFSKWMNAEFPDKKLFLFDTFESFKDEDVKKERSCNFTPDVLIEKYKNIFRNTNEEFVLSQMKYPANCVIRKGYFPDTIPDEEITYSLVSLDCDLYSPTLSGLEYFYPRLERGGFIIIHDYNHEDHWLGVKKAVKEYEKKIGHLAKVPLADNCGSLVITK